MVFKTLSRLATKRVPLIKFRKGGGAGAGGAPASKSASPAATSPVAASPNIAASSSLEPWQLPARYRRRPLNPEEIDYINRGGPP